MTTITALQALIEAAEDMHAGWKYIRSFHGDLYGVGWDRAQSKMEVALEAARACDSDTEDMAAVGRALMHAIKINEDCLEGWAPMDCPSEIVVDLINQRDEARAALSAAQDAPAEPCGRVTAEADRSGRRWHFTPNREAWEQLTRQPRTDFVHFDVYLSTRASQPTPAQDAAATAPAEHGELDARTATETARKMIAYCQSFNGQQWGGAAESVDRQNLATALDNLEETASMLLNMAARVQQPVAQGEREAVSGSTLLALFLQNTYHLGGPQQLTDWDAMAGQLSSRSSAQGAAQVPPEIMEISRRLHTQENRITSNPLFAVQQKREIAGLDDGYADSWAWVDDDCEEITDPSEIAELEAKHAEGEDTPGARRVGMTFRWEFVTGCLTEQGCKDYIKADGHNLNSPRIYAYSAHRNDEFITLRKWLMSLAAPTPTGAGDDSNGGA